MEPLGEALGPFRYPGHSYFCALIRELGVDSGTSQRPPSCPPRARAAVWDSLLGIYCRHSVCVCVYHIPIYACMHTYIPTYLTTYLPTYIPTHPSIHPSIHTYIHAYMDTCMSCLRGRGPSDETSGVSVLVAGLNTYSIFARTARKRLARSGGGPSFGQPAPFVVTSVSARLSRRSAVK